VLQPNAYRGSLLLANHVPVDLAMLAFAFSLGVGTFFSPCAVALVPAYVAYFTATGDPEAEQRSDRAAASLLDGLRFGSAAAAGVLGIFALGSLLIYLLRRRLGAVDSAQLLSTFTAAGVAVGIGLVVLGLLMLTSRAPKLALPVQAPKQRTLAGMAAFGVVFAVASMGCTLPLFFGLIGAALAQPVLTSVGMLLAFGGAIAGLLLAVSVGLALAEDKVKPLLGQAARHVGTVGGLLLVAAGLYTINFYLDIVPL
jgi:cytochrome c-type biogenesis protein